MRAERFAIGGCLLQQRQAVHGDVTTASCNVTTASRRRIAYWLPDCDQIIHAQHKFQQQQSPLESTDLLLVFLINSSNIFLESWKIDIILHFYSEHHIFR